ncbi:hypothetical protein B0O99DRAFT_710385 [Bisporella sp. PMI_857]|nr:hypothetical protein B0O99DRAFT_710385 [Bisporella sp. PMI_857]
MIADYKPQKSTVVTPAKMEEYYSRYKLKEEPYHFVSIFHTWPYKQLSRLYKGLDCEYYMVPDEKSVVPTLPGLTPSGIERWITIFMLAYPEEESKRFQKVVEDMPIDVNGVIFPERLPKQTSLHLFPKEPNQGWVNVLENLLIPEPTKAIPLERERKPYTALPGEAGVEFRTHTHRSWI